MSLRARALTLATLASVVAVSSALAGGRDTTFTVTSSLDGKTVLPVRSHWIAYPQLDPSQGQPTEVDYFIDGYHAWTAHQAPWTYGDQGNWLVTTFIKPGMHKFSIRAVTADGQVAVDTFEARVVAPSKAPAKFAGTWRRGKATLFIRNIGWVIGPNQVVDVRYLPNGNVIIGTLIVDRPEQGPACGSNPPQGYKVTLPAGDKRMQLAPIGSDTCGIRGTTFTGAWTRGR
jgi:hypothetical protein